MEKERERAGRRVKGCRAEASGPVCSSMLSNNPFPPSSHHLSSLVPPLPHDRLFRRCFPPPVCLLFLHRDTLSFSASSGRAGARHPFIIFPASPHRTSSARPLYRRRSRAQVPFIPRASASCDRERANCDPSALF